MLNPRVFCDLISLFFIIFSQLHLTTSALPCAAAGEQAERVVSARRPKPPPQTAVRAPIPIHSSLCAAYPRTDYNIRVIPEDELLQVQLATADD